MRLLKVPNFSGRQVVIYTANFGGYDLTFKPLSKDGWIDYVIFSDIKVDFICGWRNIYVDASDYPGLSSADLNRFFKFFPHRTLDSYTYSLYVDSNIRILPLIGDFIESIIGEGHEFSLPLHPESNSLRGEVDSCIKLGKFSSSSLLNSEYTSYKEAGLPEDVAVTENNIIFRDHRMPNLDMLMKEWWELYLTWSRRDQVSLPYVLWRNKVIPNKLMCNSRDRNEFFGLYPHYKNSGLRWIWVYLGANSYRSRVDEFIWMLVNRINFAAKKSFGFFFRL